MFQVGLRFFVLCIGAVTVAVMLGGCTVHPPGERQERASLLAAGNPFEKRPEKRELLFLPAAPTNDDLVQYAMLVNPDLETRYWQWRAAVEQIPQDGTQATTLNVSLSTAITKGRIGTGSSTLGFGNDPMTDIKWPGKLDAAARAALENARAAGLRFRKTQFELRSKVLAASYEYELNAELIHLAEANERLLQTAAATSEARNRAGTAGQQDVLKAKNEVDLLHNEIATMKALVPALLAALNALLDRSPTAALAVREGLPEIAPFDLDGAAILSLVAARNPELAALAAEARARSDAVRLAKLQYFPDFNVGATTDLAGIVQGLLGQVTVPLLRYEALNAAIAQAEANLRVSESMRRQTSNDLRSHVILDVSTIRDADRQLDLFKHTILPRARQAVDVARASYESGHTTLVDLLDAQRTSISIERLVVNLHGVRAKRLAELESIAAVTFEPLRR